MNKLLFIYAESNDIEEMHNIINLLKSKGYEVIVTNKKIEFFNKEDILCLRNTFNYILEKDDSIEFMKGIRINPGEIESINTDKLHNNLQFVDIIKYIDKKDLKEKIEGILLDFEYDFRDATGNQNELWFLASNLKTKVLKLLEE